MTNSFRKVSAVLLVIIMITGTFININSNNVQAGTTVLTSPDISVVGYQIKTSVSDQEGISFRTVCKAPDRGSIIAIDGHNYTVTNLGTIYTKDPNRNGKNENNVLGKTYTELNTSPYPQSGVAEGEGYKYIGDKSYQGKIVTFGYIATDKGVIEKKDGFTSYVRTLTYMNDFVLNSLHVRAFVEATDEDGNNVIIYGEYASLISVAEIAYKVYMGIGGVKAPDEEGHRYLYDSILHTLPTSNPFYKETTEEYGWGGVVQP